MEGKAVLVKNGWLEIDTIKDLSTYEFMADNGTLDKFTKSKNNELFPLYT